MICLFYKRCCLPPPGQSEHCAFKKNKELWTSAFTLLEFLEERNKTSCNISFMYLIIPLAYKTFMYVATFSWMCSKMFIQTEGEKKYTLF